MRKSAQNANVKRDYLVRLGTFWYRGDTNPGRIDAFIGYSRLSGASESFLEGEERCDALSRAHFVRLAAVHDDFAGARTGIVWGDR